MNQVVPHPPVGIRTEALCFIQYAYSIKVANWKGRFPLSLWVGITGAKFSTRPAKIYKSVSKDSQKKIERNWDGNWTILIFLKIRSIYLLFWSPWPRADLRLPLGYPLSFREGAPFPLSPPKDTFHIHLTLGLTVVAWIQAAGIFLIFTLLIIPAACAIQLQDSLRKQLWQGRPWVSWSAGWIGLSFIYDLPTGSTPRMASTLNL